MKHPICEICLNEPATSFSWLRDFDSSISQSNGSWKVAGACTAATEYYYIEFEDFIRDEHWLSHLRGKSWFDEKDFVAMLTRYQTAQPKAVNQ